ncbi:MAG: CusA/CzcA family heavy metal efflux RND transporter, partial [Cytophagales bacterium]|nr:CusA/CzcA family heavy metal efflux RND transporter [Cytophagales bacterium]
MIQNIINFSIKNKLIIGLMTFALIAAGLWSMKEVPLDAVPDITNNQVQVITTAPDLGTTDIEQFVSYPIELEMANLPGVTEIRSISRFGLSVVTIVFEDDLGTYLPRQLVSERLMAVRQEIPEKFGAPFMGPISTGLGEVYQYTLEVSPEYKDKFTPQELRTVQDWNVKRQMAMIPGVVEVNSFGGTVKQYEVAVNPDKLNSMQITLPEIYEALNKNNENTGGAYIEKNHMANFIRGEGLYKSLEDIENTVVKNNANGTPVLVKDVSQVKIGSAVRYGAFTKNGREAVGGMVLMLKNENSNEVIRNIKKRIETVQKALPKGITIKPFLDRSELIRNTTRTVASNLTEGGLIVIFVLVILLGNARGGLITASAIPLSLLFAFILMNVFDVWANLMSLGAIDFGIIVDGTVIIVEASVFYMTQHIHKNKTAEKLGQKQKDAIVRKASSRMMNSAFFGQLIILIVFLPILALTGVEGKMFRPMALTFSFAIIGAMVLCLTYVPMATALFLSIKNDPNKKPGLGDKIMNALHRIYGPALHWALKSQKSVIGLSLGLLALAGIVFNRLGGEFIPTLDEGDLAMQALLKPGSSLTEAIKASNKIETILLENFPNEVEDVVARIGVAELPTDPMPMDIADMFILLKPKDEWTVTQNKEKLIGLMKEKVSKLPGVNFEFSQPVELRFNELLTGVRQDIAVKIFGEDLSVLAQKAQKIAQLIQDIPGVGDVNIEAIQGLPQMTVQFDRSKVAQYGLNVNTLNEIINTAFAGQSAGVFFEGEKKFDLVVRLDEQHKKDIENLKNLFIPLPNSKQIPLKEVASIEFKAAPMQISREGTKRRTYVGVNVRNRDVESTVKDIQAKLESSLSLPPGYTILYGGAFENLSKAKSRLTLVVPAALGLIFILLFFSLKSIKQAIMIYMAIPLAAIGGVLSLYLRGLPFSISAGVGFIVLFGVAVLNGLVLVNSLNDLKAEGVSGIRKRIFKGAHERLRPIMLTASTDILGFLPMAVSSSAGAEVQRPLATVVIGGLLTSTLLTLVVIPVLYQWLEEREERKNKTLAPNWKKSIRPAIILLLLTAAGFSSASAQSEKNKNLTLEQAIAAAKQKHPSIKKALAGIDEAKAQKKTAFDLGNTEIFTGNEEVNGDNIQTLVGASQSIDFPTSYIAKNKLANEQVLLSEKMYELTANELVRNVSLAYYGVANAQRRVALLEQIQTRYKDFERAARLRFETEETGQLEYIAAQSKARSVDVNLTQAKADLEIKKQQLAQWIGENIQYSAVTDNDHEEPIGLGIDSTRLKENPFVKLAMKQVDIQNAKWKIQKQRLLPSFTFSYSQQKSGDRTGIYSYQAGISVPLFFRPQQGRIQAAKLKMKASAFALEERKLEMKTAIQSNLLEIRKISNTLEYYNSQAVPLAQKQIETAEKSYKAGAINYVAYIQNLDEAFLILQEYIRSLDLHHKLVVQIH